MSGAVCFACGGIATSAVEVTFGGQWIADGLVCDACRPKAAIAALRAEHRMLLDQGVPNDVAKIMIRTKIAGVRAQA